eukprot:752768-Hanusia_phi.AAC.2
MTRVFEVHETDEENKLVSFLLGCSFSWEGMLAENGTPQAARLLDRLTSSQASHRDTLRSSEMFPCTSQTSQTRKLGRSVVSWSSACAPIALSKSRKWLPSPAGPQLTLRLHVLVSSWRTPFPRSSRAPLQVSRCSWRPDPLGRTPGDRHPSRPSQQSGLRGRSDNPYEPFLFSPFLPLTNRP